MARLASLYHGNREYLSDFSSFFLVSSLAPTPEAQKGFLLSYMLTMTGFSMSSFGLFTFPYMLQEDRIEHWLTYIEHSKVSIAAYYLSKIFGVLLNFMVAIIVTFCVGGFFRDVGDASL